MRLPPIVASVLALTLLVPAVRADKADAKKTINIAHIKLTGSMAEKAPPDVDPILGNIAGETFKLKVDRLKAAGRDKKVDAVLLEINGLAAGWGKMHELAEAIKGVRKAGKKVFAHLESGNSKDYILALACDDIAIPEVSTLMLTGVRAEVSFYKGLFEKLGVKADMIQMGAFKGAAEPYTRDSLSEENRKQLTSIVDDFYEKEIVARIVNGRAGRKFTADKVKKFIDDGPYSSREAHKAGLIDRLIYFDDYPDGIKSQLKGDEVKLLKDYGKKKEDEIDFWAMFRKLIWGGGTKSAAASKGGKVAVIYATGAIMTGKSGASILGGETLGSDTLIKAIKQAEDDKTVKAIVLRVDSPGGSALASDLIWKQLTRCKKPVVASMSDVAGSGGYYIAMAAKKIYAEPGTITGSIGVVGGKIALRGLWDKAGIKSEVISRGKNSGILSTEEPFSATEKKRMTDLMKDIYDQFVDKALAGRKAAGKKMTRDELLGLAGGRIYTGRQAKENGLIDELGTLEEAIRDAAKMGGLSADKDPELLLLPKSKGPLDALLGSMADAKLNGVKVDLSQVPQLREKFGGLDALLGLKSEPVWLIVPYRLDVK